MDELIKRLHRYTENCVAYKLDADFASAVQEAADAIEELTGFVQEAERDRDEYRERLDKANDAIEELSKKRDAACWGCKCEKIEPSVWISVTERLPLLNTPVLATDGIEVDISWMYGVPPRWITSFTAIDEDKLTHWMPLPQTPKGK